MFGKNRERIRQWSLLGHLLGKLSPIDALDFLDMAFGSKVVEWKDLRNEIAAGAALSASARKPSRSTPKEVLRALDAGEKEGDLPAQLRQATVDEAAPYQDSATDESIVVLVNGLFMGAVQGGATGMVLQRLDGGDGQTKVFQGQAWTVHSRHPAEEYAAVVRRIYAMCSQPYWDPKPASFTMRMFGGESVEFRVTPDGKGGLGIEVLRKASR